MPLIDWQGYFRGRTLVEHALASPSSVLDFTLPLGEDTKDVGVIAVVNGGRWICRCPDPDCRGAELANFEEPHFFCCECRNARWGHRTVPVIGPLKKDRKRIETILMKRPLPITRNWEANEEIADLKRQNKEHEVA